MSLDHLHELSDLRRQVRELQAALAESTARRLAIMVHRLVKQPCYEDCGEVENWAHDIAEALPLLKNNPTANAAIDNALEKYEKACRDADQYKSCRYCSSIIGQHGEDCPITQWNELKDEFNIQEK